MDPVTQCCVSLENNNGHVKGQNASEVKSFHVKKA